MIWALNPTQQHIKCNYTQLHGFNAPSTPGDEGAPFLSSNQAAGSEAGEIKRL